jgi:FkbM family methyltransferase
MTKYLDVGGVKLIIEFDRICISVLGILDKASRGPMPFEPESLLVWEEVCSRPGARVLDIGAYTGLYSLIARKAGARVTAFEPLERNRQRFRDNAALNGFPDLKVNSEAVSDRCGETFIATNLAVRGLSSGASIVRKVGANAVKVRTLTIDSLNLAECTAIKIDVERAEPLVLAGARETLARCRPELLVEVLGDVEKAAVRAAVPGYRVDRQLDTRNWLLLPDKKKRRSRAKAAV